MTSYPPPPQMIASDIFPIPQLINDSASRQKSRTLTFILHVKLCFARRCHGLVASRAKLETKIEDDFSIIIKFYAIRIGGERAKTLFLMKKIVNDFNLIHKFFISLHDIAFLAPDRVSAR